MPVEDRTRHDRLRSLLPRAYASDPREHALGVMLEVLADGLRESDRFVERALRDRWLRTATAPREFEGVVSVGGLDGWLDDANLPAAMVSSATSMAEALGGRLIKLLVPKPPAGEPLGDVSLAVLEILRPAELARYGDPVAATAALAELLDGLALELGAPEPLDDLIVDEVSLRRARWTVDGAGFDPGFEAGYAPAGPFTALVLIRGQPTTQEREDIDTLIASIEGLSGDAPPSLPAASLAGHPHPLELLGAALDLRRQPWESDVETYRNRVRILAPMLTEGLATPRVMLAFTLTSLHAEPCPILERPDPDSTRGYGLPPRTLDRCRVCRGGRRPPPGASCPMRARTLMEATVTDNPRTRVTLSRSRLTPGAGDEAARLRIYNDSLFSARPQIVLRVHDDAPDQAVIPCIRNRSTGEEIIVATPLSPGDEVTLRPASPWQPSQLRHRQLWVDPPAGEQRLPARAWVLREGSNSFEIIDDEVVYAAGPRFGKSRFCGPSEAALFDIAPFDEVLFDTPTPDAETEQFRFAATGLSARTPSLAPGDNVWMVSLLTEHEIETHLELPPELDSLGCQTTTVAIGLSWWTRPPARFRVRVNLVPAVERVLERGAARYLRRLVDRVRPAGVHPIIDFAVEPMREALEPEVRRVGVGVRSHDALEPGLEVRSDALEQDGRGEPIEPEDRLAFLGVFDVTSLDWSLFAEREIEPGAFDRTVFDKALLHDLVDEPAVLDQTYFNHALLANHDEGEFGQAHFGMALFA